MTKAGTSEGRRTNLTAVFMSYPSIRRACCQSKISFKLQYLLYLTSKAYKVKPPHKKTNLHLKKLLRSVQSRGLKNNLSNQKS